MKHISWIITLPLLAIAVIFAVNHRQTVEIDLWPLPLAVDPPMYLIVLGAIFVGFVLGGGVVWWSQGRNRRRAREFRVRAQEAEYELSVVKTKLERAEAELKTLREQAPANGGTQPRLGAPGARRPQALPRTGS